MNIALYNELSILKDIICLMDRLNALWRNSSISSIAQVKRIFSLDYVSKLIACLVSLSFQCAQELYSRMPLLRVFGSVLSFLLTNAIPAMVDTHSR